jgi:hypothetical protein
LQSALTALAATNPRDPIEVMLGVQAISAYQAACACWRTGMNSRAVRGDGLRHVAAAGAAARTFDQMLRAIERRQAKPLTVPVGRPAPAVWSENSAGAVLDDFADRIRRLDQGAPVAAKTAPEEPPVRWSLDDVAFVERLREQRRIEAENKGLDIANTEGILPCGGMILPADPTPQQAAYIGRRLALMYRREYQENLKKGIRVIPKLRPIRTGDLIP